MIASIQELGITTICGDTEEIANEMLVIMKGFADDLAKTENGKEVVNIMFHTEPEIVTNFCKVFVQSTH